MKQLPKARVEDDGSLSVPPETKVLLYRVLGDVTQTLTLEEPAPEGELEALAELKRLLAPEGTGRLPPVARILELRLPPKRVLHRVK